MSGGVLNAVMPGTMRAPGYPSNAPLGLKNPGLGARRGSQRGVALAHQREYQMLIQKLREVAAAGRRMVGIDEHARVFNKHYRKDAWIGGGSGSGSTPEFTISYREFLADFLKKRSIRSVVDLGCGDWQFSRLIDWSGINYTGIDVSTIARKNIKMFAKPGIRFIEMNGASPDLPTADLLIMKDVIQHWSNEDIEKFLPNLPKFKYALITNGSHKGSGETNLPSRAGGCRPVDLTAAPFALRGEYVFEFQADEPKITFLWRKA
jgi:SAM-dependent methyltransferase